MLSRNLCFLGDSSVGQREGAGESGESLQITIRPEPGAMKPRQGG